MNSRKLLLSLIGAVVVLALAGYAMRVPLSIALMQQMAARRIAANPLQKLPDGLHVVLCGAGSPLPDSQRGAPCTLVIAGKRIFMIDAGSGAARSINRMGFNPGELDTLFLTHFHSDHIDGLGELMLQRWAGASRTAPLPVLGPDGVEQVVDGFNQTYRQDKQYRVAHHGPDTIPPEGFGGLARAFATPAPGARVVLIDEPELQVVAFSVDHKPVHPAVGYRIRYKDRIVVLSGDTAKSMTVQREAIGVDLLVHEALSPPLVAVLGEAAGKAGRPKLQKIFHDIPDYHTTPHQAAEIARDAGVGMLLLNHIVPALPLPGLEAAFLGDAGSVYPGKLKVGSDGDLVSLPAGGKSIIVSSLL